MKIWSQKWEIVKLSEWILFSKISWFIRQTHYFKTLFFFFFFNFHCHIGQKTSSDPFIWRMVPLAWLNAGRGWWNRGKAVLSCLSYRCSVRMTLMLLPKTRANQVDSVALESWYMQCNLHCPWKHKLLLQRMLRPLRLSAQAAYVTRQNLFPSPADLTPSVRPVGVPAQSPPWDDVLFKGFKGQIAT